MFFQDIEMEQLNMGFSNEINNSLKSFFGKHIKSGFLISVLEELKKSNWPEIVQYYDMEDNIEDSYFGVNIPEFDLCRLIIGVHNSNTIFLSDDERGILQKDKNYKEKLIKDVLDHVRLRGFASIYFRNQTLISGDLFITYDLPYELFVISIRTMDILNDFELSDVNIYLLYAQIMRQSIAIMSLLEDNIFESCYPLCRMVIELYLKMRMIKANPNISKICEDFRIYEIKQACGEQEHSKEFLDRFNKRKRPANKNKIEYLHFGWVDHVLGYHRVIDKTSVKPYTINGIIEYLKKTFKDETEDFEKIEEYFKMCNGYTHGNVSIATYKLLHYFEISEILYLTVGKMYPMICETLKIDTKINGINIVEKLNNNYKKLDKQYSQCSLEKFKEYYNSRPIK